MPLSISELEALLQQTESDLAERKESLSSSAKDKVAEAICAFSNDLPSHGKPGIIFIGAKDNGEIAGTAIDDSLLLNLAALRSDGNILPLPLLIIQRLELSGANHTQGAVAVVEVHPSQAPPVRYKGQVWIRVGPRRAVASREEERVLNEKRRAYDLPFDARPLPSADISDLDATLFERTYLPSALSPEVIAENGRDLAQQLSSLRFLSNMAPPSPTAAGILVVGKDPRSFLPGAYVQFVRYQGTDLTAPITDSRELSGPLPELIPQLDDVLRANISTSLDLTSADIEIRRPDYPLAALQQLIRNALMHRNYETSNAPVRLYWFDDRIEMHSPGGPFGQVTVQNFGQPGITDYRNPTVAEGMKNLGFVQRFGVGIATAQKLLDQNGNPPALFDVQDNFILALVKRAA